MGANADGGLAWATRWIDVMAICRPFEMGIMRISLSRPLSNRKCLLQLLYTQGPHSHKASSCAITSGEVQPLYPTSFSSRPMVVIYSSSNFPEQKVCTRLRGSPHEISLHIDQVRRARVSGSSKLHMYSSQSIRGLQERGLRLCLPYEWWPTCQRRAVPRDLQVVYTTCLELADRVMGWVSMVKLSHCDEPRYMEYEKSLSIK